MTGCGGPGWFEDEEVDAVELESECEGAERGERYARSFAVARGDGACELKASWGGGNDGIDGLAHDALLWFACWFHPSASLAMASPPLIRGEGVTRQDFRRS